MDPLLIALSMIGTTSVARPSNQVYEIGAMGVASATGATGPIGPWTPQPDIISTQTVTGTQVIRCLD